MVLKTTCSSTMNRKRDPSNISNLLPENPSDLNGPVAILWDMENCCIPNGITSEEVAGNIRKSLQMHGIRDPITTISAYGDFSNKSRSLSESCQRSGINLIDVPNGRKDAADKAILADMFLFELDNSPLSTILLDADFASGLDKLGQQGYVILVAILNFKRTCSALWRAAKFVWECPEMARNQCRGEPPDQILCREKTKVGVPELSVNNDFCWNLRRRKEKQLSQQNTRNQKNISEVGNCGFPSEITMERNPTLSLQSIKTKPADCGIPSETKAESNPTSLMHSSKNSFGEFGLHSEIAEPNSTSVIQPTNMSLGTCGFPLETTEPNQMFDGLFWFYLNLKTS